MSSYVATVQWERGQAVFTDQRYSRAHTWLFDGGARVLASSSPHVVRLPWSDPAGVDPEEALVASVASCHMLWFLSLAAEQGWVVDSYTDAAQGVMEKNAQGKLWVARVDLRPHTVFSGTVLPTDDTLAALHHRAHEECFIAQSVRSDIVTHPSWAVA